MIKLLSLRKERKINMDIIKYNILKLNMQPISKKNKEKILTIITKRKNKKAGQISVHFK